MATLYPCAGVILGSIVLTGGVGLRAAAPPSWRRFSTVTVQNTEPGRDDRGQIIDVHDGCLRFFEGRYYLYGTAYGESAGFGINNRLRVYSSADLATWRW